MISDAKEVREAYERQKKKALKQKRKPSETVGLCDIQVKRGLEIPVDEGTLCLPSEEPSSTKADSIYSLCRRTSIRTKVK